MLDFAEIFRREDGYPKTLLDIGCGPCPEGRQILERGISLTGIDQDGETIRIVKKRLPQGRFITGDAALWLPGHRQRYDAVLLRRPDVIFRSANWHQIFRQLPSILSENGMAAVTAPGESEARLCERWLRETADIVTRCKTGMAEEEFLIMAENFRQNDTEENLQSSLIRRLAWEDDQPHMVCDLRTGRCTMADDQTECRTSSDDKQQ